MHRQAPTPAKTGTRLREGPGIERSVRRAELWAAVGLGGFLLALVLLGWWRGVDDLVAELRRIDVLTFAGLLGLSLFNYLMRALRWHLFARQQRILLPFGRQALYYVAGFALTVTPGKLGEILRLWLLRRGHGYPYERTGSLLVADRLGDGLAMLAVSLVGITAFAQHRVKLVVVGGAILAGLVVLLRPQLSAAMLGLAYGMVGRGSRLFVRLRKLSRETSALLGSRAFVASLFLGILGWLAEATALWWLLATLGSPIGFTAACFAFAFSMLVGAAVMLPGGLGGTEAGMVVLLLGLGVPTEAAIAATAVIRVTTLWFAVGLGFGTLPFALRSVRATPAPVLRTSSA